MIGRRGGEEAGAFAVRKLKLVTSASGDPTPFSFGLWHSLCAHVTCPPSATELSCGPPPGWARPSSVRGGRNREGRVARPGAGWEASGWPVGLGFGARTQGRFGRGALKAHISGCRNAVGRIALRVAAQVESSQPCRLRRLWTDAEPRMLSCPGTLQSLE